MRSIKGIESVNGKSYAEVRKYDNTSKLQYTITTWHYIYLLARIESLGRKKKEQRINTE